MIERLVMAQGRWKRSVLGTTVLLGALLTSEVAAQESFVRGDANSDGAFTISDARAIAAFLFQQSPELPCLAAADVNGEEGINFTDVVAVFGILFRGWRDPVEPFPDPGTAETNLSCVAYGNGETIVDPSSRLAISSAVPTDSDTVLITLSLSNSLPIAGYSARIEVIGDVLQAVRFDGMKELTSTLVDGFAAATVQDGVLRVGFLPSVTEPVTIPAGTDVPVAEIEVCLKGGTEAGEYSLRVEQAELIDVDSSRAILPSLEGAGSNFVLENAVPVDSVCPSGASEDPPCRGDYLGDPDFEGQSVEFLRGDTNADGRFSISDAVFTRRWVFNCDAPPNCEEAADANGDGRVGIIDIIYSLNALVIGGQTPVAPYPEAGPGSEEEDLSCISYEPEAPRQSEDVIHILDVDGVPGENVEIPVLLTNSREVEAVQLVLSYDSEVFQPDLGDLVNLEVGYFGDTLQERFEGFDVHVWPVDGELVDVIAIGFVPSVIRKGFEVPPGVDTLLFTIKGTIAPDADPDSFTLLQAFEGENGGGYGHAGMLTELTYGGAAEFASVEPRTIPGRLGVQPDLSIFVRGDTNDDLTTDISDASTILNFLFLGGRRPGCLDAADTDDDGAIVVTDATYLLNYLFLGGPSLPPPNSPGADPTPDGIGCLFFLE